MNRRSGSLTDFEQGVRLVLFSKSKTVPATSTGDAYLDIIRVFRRLDELAKNEPNLVVDIEMNRGEAWVGAFCKDRDLAIFYQYKDGQGQIFTAGGGDGSQRVITVFGESQGFFDLTAEPPIARLSRRLRTTYPPDYT